MKQMIPTGIWTKLLNYEIEVCHQRGHNIMVEVVNGKITPTPNVDVELRPTGGIYDVPWRPPIAGWYRLDYNDGQEHVPASAVLNPDMIVIQPARKFTTEQGDVVYRGPEFATNSGSPVLTEQEFGPVMTVEWNSNG